MGSFLVVFDLGLGGKMWIDNDVLVFNLILAGMFVLGVVAGFILGWGCG